jgi:hypothetical protein
MTVVVAFIRSVAAQAESLAERGCPIGTLTAELGKQGGDLAEARRLIRRVRSR